MRRHGLWVALVAWLAGVPAGAADFTLRGTVVGPGGAPVSEGRVSFGEFWSGSIESPRRFEAQVPEVPPGRYPLVYTDEHGALTFAVVPVVAGQREAEVTLRMGEDLMAKGRVVSADMPDGVPNAQVTVEGTIDGKPWRYTQLAGAHGEFAFYGKALTGFAVTATGPYHQPSQPATIAAPFPMQIELRLPRQTMVIGQVLTEANGFIGPEATIAVFTKGYMVYTKSDRQGRFEFDALPPGDYIVWAFAPGKMPESMTLRLAPEQQVMGLTLHLPFAPIRLVSGTVVGPDGKTGVSGAAIEFRQMLIPPPGAMPGGLAGGFAPETTYNTAVSGENGYYGVMLPVLPPEMVARQTQVTIKAEGYLPRRYTVYREALFAGAADFQVFHGGRLHGTVRMLDGRPLPEGTEVRVLIPDGVIGPQGSSGGSLGYAATLDLATGQFDFGLVQPGEDWVLVEAHGDRLSQTKVTVREGEDSQLEDVAEPPGMVHGEATGAEEAGDFGDPKAPIKVEVYAPLSLEWHQKTIALLREYDRQHPGRIFVRLMPMGDAAYDAEMQKRGFIAAVIFINGEHAFTLPDGRRVDLQKRPNGEGSSYNSADVVAVVEGMK